MKYRTVYACWVINELKDGKTVYALDRRLRKVFTLNDMEVNAAIALINSAEEDSNRYDFWYEETEENENA